MFIQKLFNKIDENRLEVFLGVCVFMLAVFGASVKHVASYTLALLFLSSCFYVKHWRTSWRSLSVNEKNVLIGFLVFTGAGIMSYYNASDDYEYIKELGRYLRFSIAVPVFLFLVYTRCNLYKYLIYGVIVSGPVYLGFALYSWYNNPHLPAQFGYHHTMFGDAAMLNAGIMAAWLLTCKQSKLIKGIVVVSIFCALYASILSQSRGAWIVLPAYALILVYYSLQTRVVRLRYMVITLAIIIASIAVSPAKDIISSRYNQAVSEVQQFSEGKNLDSSVGTRLAMWAIAVDVWKQHPLIGTGLGNFDEEIKRIQAEGEYREIYPHDDSHNVYFQTLATTGLIGLVIFMVSMIILPLILFNKSGKWDSSKNLTGIILIVSFVIFGLTWSWIMRAPFIAVYLVFYLVIATSLRFDDEGGRY